MTYLPIGDEAHYRSYLDEQALLRQQYNNDPLFCTGQKIDEIEHRICEYLLKTRTIQDPALKSMAKLVIQDDLEDHYEILGIDEVDVLEMLRVLADDDRLFVTTDAVVVAGFDYKVIESKEKDTSGVLRTSFSGTNRPLALPVCDYFWEEYGDQLDRQLPVLTSDEFLLTCIDNEVGCVRSVNFNISDGERINKALELVA